MCGDQRTLGVTVQEPLTLFFETGSLRDLRLTNEARLTRGQPRASPVLEFKPMALILAFSRVLGIRLGYSCLYSKHFTEISPQCLILS